MNSIQQFLIGEVAIAITKNCSVARIFLASGHSFMFVLPSALGQSGHALESNALKMAAGLVMAVDLTGVVQDG